MDRRQREALDRHLTTEPSWRTDEPVLEPVNDGLTRAQRLHAIGIHSHCHPCFCEEF